MMYRKINTKLRIFWSRSDKAYVATLGLFPGMSATGKTAERALLELAREMQSQVEILIEEGDSL